MTHKEKMNWLKENDPIQYYELTSDPTGGSEDISWWIIPSIVTTLLILTIIYILTK